MKVLVALVLLGACYGPDIPAAGVACPDGVCPDPYLCFQPSGTCQLPGYVDKDAPTDSSLLDGTDRLCAIRSAGGPVCVDHPVASGTPELVTMTDQSAFCSTVAVVRGTESCVIAARHIVVPADSKTYSAAGARPLVLLADTIEIDGRLLASVGGAGANVDASCSSVTGGFGSGGPGGSAFGSGGNGGPTNPANMGAQAGPAVLPQIFQGGCKGANGNGSTGGPGGGALYLAATTSIRVTGTIAANGGGGIAGLLGGSGGGAGGMIVLDAPSVTVAGSLFANGGGGAGGGNGTDAGGDGKDGAESAVAAAGGNGSGGGGNGGQGAVYTTVDGTHGQAGSVENGIQGRGGGGGGGIGYLAVIGQFDDSGTESPPVFQENPAGP